MDRDLVQVHCSHCGESLPISTAVSCAECLCEWCAHSFVYVSFDGSIHLIDLAAQSWLKDSESLAAQYGFRFLDVERLAIKAETFELVARKMAREMDVMAVEVTPSEITVAAACVTRFDFFEWLRFYTGRSVVPCLASRDAIHRALALQVLDNQHVRYDPLEDVESARPLIRRAYKEAKQEVDQYWLSLSDPSKRDYGLYFSHLCRRQKRILEQEFGITWSSPMELNPAFRMD